MSESSQASGSAWRRWLWPSWQQRKQALTKQAWVVIIAAYLAISFAYLYPQNFSNTSTAYVLGAWAAFMVQVLIFHLGLLLLLITCLAAWGRRRVMMTAAMVPAAFALTPAVMTWVPHRAPVVAGPTMKVMSVNLLMINKRVDPMLEEIRRVDPDVLLLQEYTAFWEQTFMRELGQVYPHHDGVPQDDSFGAAIYSKRPFIGPVRRYVPMGDTRVPQMRAVVRIGEQPVALYNVHLLPPRKLDYIVTHRLQFADLVTRLESEPLPCIVAGDFNFTETTPNARALHRAGLTDVQDQVGLGRGATWPVNSFLRHLPIPGLRLDHIYISDELAATDMQRGVGLGSDHRPVVATLGLRASD